jgi:hypothetical protein
MPQVRQGMQGSGEIGRPQRIRPQASLYLWCLGSRNAVQFRHVIRVIDRGWLCSEVRSLDQRLNGKTVFVDTGFLVP